MMKARTVKNAFMYAALLIGGFYLSQLGEDWVDQHSDHHWVSVMAPNP
jgi:hypothetical protein